MNAIKTSMCKPESERKTRPPQLAALKSFYSRNPWYRHWQSAKQRCSNPKAGSYEYYGGRGIRCLLTKDDAAYLWRRDKAHLLQRASLDKIDSDKDYSRANCRFIEHRLNCKKASRDAKRRRARQNAPALARLDGAVGHS